VRFVLSFSFYKERNLQPRSVRLRSRTALEKPGAKAAREEGEGGAARHGEEERMAASGTHIPGEIFDGPLLFFLTVVEFTRRVQLMRTALQGPR
jgi:hypothetical protein